MSLIDSYDNFHKWVIDPIIKQVVDAGSKDGVRLNLSTTTASHPYNKIKNKFEEYSLHCRTKVGGGRIDRHKIAACLCGAVLHSEPLIFINGKRSDFMNATVALHIGAHAIKLFMAEDIFIQKTDFKLRQGILDDFEMKFIPISENTHDKYSYENNLANGMRYLMNCYDDEEKACGKFDVWAYSTIFYHIEKYNQERLDDFCKSRKLIPT